MRIVGGGELFNYILYKNNVIKENDPHYFECISFITKLH